MRITSGLYRNRKIITPGGATHPMGERERLALFNMINDFVPDALVLDAFAGSGALGLEALSRGAFEVVFVEKNSAACRVIKQNLQNIGARAEVICKDVGNFSSEAQFDIILADPPYDRFELSEVTHLLQFLRDGGILVLSHPSEAPVLPEMELEKTRKYAGARISVYFKR